LYVINEADHIAVPAPIRILLSTEHFKRLLNRKINVFHTHTQTIRTHYETKRIQQLQRWYIQFINLSQADTNF
jgi:hypothetical protein